MRFNDEDLSKLPRITDIKDFTILSNNKKVYTEKGLFSEQIFGNVIDYNCQCDKMIGKLYENQICPNCGVKLTSATVRSKNIAVIEVPFLLLKPNIIFTKHSKIIKLIKMFENLKLNEKASEINENENVQNLSLSDFIIKNMYDKLTQKEFDELLPKVTTRFIVVIPPSLRPIFENSIDSINEFYKNIISHVNEYGKTKYINYMMDIKIWKTYCELIILLKKKMSGKEGFIRDKILGRRIEMSARSVITPDPYLYNKIRIPYKLLVHILEPYLYHLPIQPIHKYITEIKNGNYNFDGFNEIKKEMNNICNNNYVVINRAPTLHISNIQAYSFEPTTNNSIQIPINIVGPFNADFDGDSIEANVKLYDKNGNLIFDGLTSEIRIKHCYPNNSFFEY